MITKVAILTADPSIGERLRDALAPLGPSLLVRMVRDEPDLSFRSLRVSDVVICGIDVSRERIMRLVRALGRTGEAGRFVRIVAADNQRGQVLESLGLGARAVVPDDRIESDIGRAVREVLSDRLYLSQDLIPYVLERYRELCEELRRVRDAEPIEEPGTRRYFSR